MNINEQANFIWSIADLLRGDFKQSEYGKVILPFTVLRRFDCVLAPSKAKILEAYKTLTVSNKRPIFKRMTGHDYYNVSQFDFEKLMDDSNAMEKQSYKIVLADKGLENWKHVEPNDFIISLRSFQGGLEISYIPGCITWHYIVLKPKVGVEPEYFKWLFKSPRYIQALQRTANFIRDGQDLRFSNFVQVPLPLIPMDEQKEIAEYLNKETARIDSIIADITEQIEKLKEYRQSVISEVVTGKVAVE